MSQRERGSGRDCARIGGRKPDDDLSACRAGVGGLDAVADYYIVAAGADRAGALIASIVERFRLLSEHPRIGVARPELSPDLRSYAAPGTSYVIFYIPREYGIEVVRVLHGRRDLAPLFG